jgi:hypothetical protein
MRDRQDSQTTTSSTSRDTGGEGSPVLGLTYSYMVVITSKKQVEVCLCRLETARGGQKGSLVGVDGRHLRRSLRREGVQVSRLHAWKHARDHFWETAIASTYYSFSGRSKVTIFVMRAVILSK